VGPDQAASVKARLLARAEHEGEEFEKTLARFAAERLLDRLGASPLRERSVLKAAALLAVWLTNPHRAPRDVELLARYCVVLCGLRFGEPTGAGGSHRAQRYGWEEGNEDVGGALGGRDQASW